VMTAARGAFSSLPVRSGILWEGSCLVSFWISCETEPARLPGTERSYLIFKELKTTVCAAEYCTGNGWFGWFVWISGLPSLLKVVTLSLNPNAAASAKCKSEDRFRLKYAFLAQASCVWNKVEFSLVQRGESMRNIQSLIQQSVANKDISLRFPSTAGMGHRNAEVLKWVGLGEGLVVRLFWRLLTELECK